MKPEWLQLAGEFLELASEKFSNHGCNDWEWPGDWSPEDRKEFAEALDRATDGEGTDYVGKYGPPDWLVMSFLAELLRSEGVTS